MKKLPFVIFAIIMISALCSGVNSYHCTESLLAEDANKALSLALMEMPGDVISADTIQCYRNHLTIAELKDTASITMRTVRRDDRLDTEFVAEANCDFLTVLKLSNQKASSAIVCIGILWLLASTWYMRKYRPELFAKGLTYGGIQFTDNKFTTISGEQIHLTPMQHTLLTMFMESETHTLSKQEICDRLWPKKPDASDTLYTLIRRIKPIIEANSKLKIESDRGKSYSLEIK